MLYDTKIVIGGYVGAYIEKYMQDLCARVDARDSFMQKSQSYLVHSKYIHMIDEFFEII